MLKKYTKSTPKLAKVKKKYTKSTPKKPPHPSRTKAVSKIHVQRYEKTLNIQISFIPRCLWYPNFWGCTTLPHFFNNRMQVHFKYEDFCVLNIRNSVVLKSPLNWGFTWGEIPLSNRENFPYYTVFPSLPDVGLCPGIRPSIRGSKGNQV